MWPLFCLGALSLILLSYFALIVSNIAYLGLSDLLIFLPRERLWVRVGLTFYTSFVATLLSLSIGIPAGYALSRLKLPWPALTETLMDLPVMVPPAAIGAFLLGFVTSFPVKQICAFLNLEFAHNTSGVILVQFVVTLAFCCRLMKSSFDRVNPRFEAVSRSLGSSMPETLWKVTLPMAKNGILASALIVWARAAAEWEALMLFVGGTMGKTDVLPFSVYLDWNGGMMGEVITYSLISVVMAVLSMSAMHYIGGKSHAY
jgi:molybdate transport system permease protein